MATPSAVKAGLDDIAAIIRNERNALIAAKARIAAAESTLNGLPAQFSGFIAAIDAYTGADEFEALAQAEKTQLAAEFQALKTKATTAKTALAAVDFTT